MAEDKGVTQAQVKVQAGGPNMILMVLFVFVAAFGGAFLAFSLLPKNISVNQTIEEAREPHEGDHLPTYPLGDFVVNLADVSGNRFLKLSLTAKVYSEDFEEYAELEAEEKHAYHLEIEHDITPSMPAIKDVIITSLSRKTAEEISGYENKIALKIELKEQINQVLHGEFHIYDLYITDFIIQ
jgi:flagellar basal body-associated protein FliL